MSTISAGTNVNTSLNYSADTTGNLVLQSSGSSIILGNTANTIIMGGSVITSGTAVASTSGTSIDFTGIPSWAKRITVMFSGVSTSGTSNIQIQVGSGSVQTTGYASAGSYSGPSGGGGNSTTGLIVVYGPNAVTLCSGIATITLLTSATWVCGSILARNAETYTQLGGGTVTLGGVLDRVRVTTVNGTDTFDAGSINILYE